MDLPTVIDELISEYNDSFRVRDSQMTLTFDKGDSGHGSKVAMVTKVKPGLWTSVLNPFTVVGDRMLTAFILHHKDFDLSTLPALEMKAWVQDRVQSNVPHPYLTLPYKNITICTDGETRSFNVATLEFDDRARSTNVYTINNSVIIVPLSLYNRKWGIFIKELRRYVVKRLDEIADSNSAPIRAIGEENTINPLDTQQYFPFLTNISMASISFYGDEGKVTVLAKTITSDRTEEEYSIERGNTVIREMYPYLQLLYYINNNNIEKIDGISWVATLWKEVTFDEQIEKDGDFEILDEEGYALI